MRISDWSSDVCSSDLSDAEFAAWGWRIPFLVSAVLVGLGLWVRLKIHETPAFAEAMEREPPVGVPLGAVLRDHARAARGHLRGRRLLRDLLSRDQLRARARDDRARLSEGRSEEHP